MATRIRSLLFVLAPCLVGSVSLAQVPDGHFVTAHNGTPLLGAGGLFTFHPRNGTWAAIAGLPPDLTAGTPIQAGASAVAIMPDGTLTVGQLTAQGVPLYLYHLAINAGTATVKAKIQLGQGTGTNTQAAVQEIEVLGPDRVLVCVTTANLGVIGPPGPLANHHLGIVTLSTAVVQPCPMVPMPAGVAYAVASDGTWAYVAMFEATLTQTNIWKVSCTQLVPPFVPPVLVISLPGFQITNLELNAAGQLLATSGGPIYTINIALGAITNQCPYGGGIAFATERATGTIAGVMGRTTNQSVWTWTPPCGVKTTLAAPPAGGWGIPNGIAVAHDPAVYGAPTPLGGPDYRFVMPNPGGLPWVGSATFSLSVADRTGVAPAGVWLLSAAALVPPLRPLPGIDLHVAPPWVQIPLTANQLGPATLPLPIPNLPAYLGASVFVQTVHPFGNGLAASEGLRVTIL